MADVIIVPLLSDALKFRIHHSEFIIPGAGVTQW
jgi:hypothetical protein